MGVVGVGLRKTPLLAQYTKIIFTNVHSTLVLEGVTGTIEEVCSPFPGDQFPWLPHRRFEEMKNVILATVVAAMASAVASADITNGDFSDGSVGWDQFGGSEGPYGVDFFGGSAAVVAYGTFGGTPNYSGYTQTLAWAGEFAEGDTINFGGEMYIENGKDLFANNNANVQLNFWYGGGYDYGFSIVAGTLNTNSATGVVYSFDMEYLLDAGAASATRISLDFTYVQTDIPGPGGESGAAWGTNFYGGIVPAPGAMALLGLAGLAGRRRRN